jgi:hypothetical protein
MSSIHADTEHQGLMAGAARVAAPFRGAASALAAPAVPVADEAFPFAGIPMAIHAHPAWKTWDLQPAYSVNCTDRLLPRPLERSP